MSEVTSIFFLEMRVLPLFSWQIFVLFQRKSDNRVIFLDLFQGVCFFICLLHLCFCNKCV